MPFKAPRGSSQYIENVISRVNSIVDVGIWDIDKSRVTGWLAQFRTVDERYFAACLLDSLIYRSQQQFLACTRALFRGPLRWACGGKLPGISDLDLLHALQSETDRGIRLVPVIRDSDPPTKSGPLVLRYIKRALDLQADWMIWPWNVQNVIESNKLVHTIVFVDDFLGSGSQFTQFITKQRLPLHNTSVQWIYAPIFGHKAGIKFVSEAHQGVNLVPMERLDETHGFFHENQWKLLSDGAVSNNDAMDFYADFMKRRSIDTRETSIFGFGDLGLCFGCKHGTPDNSLPILWAQSANWSCLLER
jgi:hypothetical protein